MITKNRKFGKGIESLEAKTMMAGDVAVSFDAGDLFLNEAAGDIGENQQVQVSQLTDGRIQVQGLNGTELDYVVRRGDALGRGQSVEVIDADTIIISGMQNLNANLGEGNDLFQTTGEKMSVNNVNIDMGIGNDSDRVNLQRVVASGLVSISTGGGNDSVQVASSTLLNDDDALEVFTGDGLDSVNIFRVFCEGDVLIDTSDNNNLNERDTVNVIVSEMDDLEINLGGGNDQVDLAFVDLDTAEVNAGDGDDDVHAAAVDAFLFDYNGGSGFDEFFNYRTNYGYNPDNDFQIDWFSSVEQFNDKDDL
ncbi:hypothetical protein [Aeoliella mucimassa]|uniref:Uncharacterized protein n=1 Tax=Aeoliella mucimassa TaxID=2527972 RepID=A0A518AV55_9BACT|nr:hypothetical protein [Aeoliella mucimassa]QDU58609.1 hypothetical protein Pan181_48480 [Aeoliella mucimassa]